MSSASGIGGVETWLSKVVSSLPTDQFEPIVALTRGLRSNDPDHYRRLQGTYPEVVEVLGSGLPSASRILACLRTIKRINPDIVLPLGVIEAVPACGLAKQGGQSIRVVCRTQGLLAPMLADLKELAPIFDFAVCDGKLNFLFLDHIIGFPRSRMRHIPNGADRPTRARVSRTEDDPIRLLYLGRLTAIDKRATDLVPLVTELDSLGVAFKLNIVGDGPSRHAIESALECYDNVIFTGSLPHQHVYDEILPSADVLISLSSSESFGISIVEAMMHGVVPVSSRFLGHKTVGTIEHGVNALLFDIGDMQQAASYIAKLANDADMLESLAYQAASKARSAFNWDNCVNSWMGVFEKLQQEAPRPAEITLSSFIRSDSGRLDRLRLPVEVVDLMRRVRSAITPAVKAGGEEWPLYFRHHSTELLEEINHALTRLNATSQSNEYLSAFGAS